jgi:peptide/nickel transport system substrate-binding protein
VEQADRGLGRRELLRGLAGAGAAAGMGGLLGGCGPGAPGATGSPAAGSPAARRRGGHLKVGLVGGSTSDTVDPHKGLTYTDTARQQALYSPLVQLGAQAQVEYVLAESITPDHGSPSQWIIRLRPGVTFHDGQDLTADDVIFSFRRILSQQLSGSTGLGPVDLAGLRRLDQLTVAVAMKQPYASFPEQLAAFWYYLYIAPASFDPARPNGTGPFTYQSFTPGQQSVFTRNPHYFKAGLPYAQTLTILDFSDSVSLQNALLTGVIQGAGTLDGSQAATLSAAPGVRTVISRAGSITPFTMRVDQPPFSDVRVRQAMRLIVGRPQLISAALSGYGTVASDVFSPFDPDYDRSRHRVQDLPQARFLLKQAGRADLAVPLVTSAISAGTTQMATVLAQQAAAAGVTISLRTVQPDVFFGPSYRRWTFAQDYYNYSPYLAQAAFSMLPDSPFNETHTDSAAYNRWYAEANATFDPARRREVLHEMQEFDFTRGGYIIPAFIDSLDAYSTKITGYTAARVGQPLSNFDFESFAFAG